MPRNIERDKREADRRKNQLIEAGFRLFSQNGIETVSLQKVADAANVSPATMYKYFLTKEKLLIAISAKVWDEVWQEALGDPGTNHFEHGRHQKSCVPASGQCEHRRDPESSEGTWLYRIDLV